MNKYCERCYLRDAKPCMECSTCNPGHRNFKPAPTPLPTNADRIRSMSDEELAEFIDEISGFQADYLRYKGTAIINGGLLDWLRQPVEEVNE